MKVKIQVKSFWGKVLFEAEKEDYTLKRALRDAVLRGADFKKLPNAFVNECSRELF